MLPKPFRQCPLSLLKTPDPLGVRVKRKNYPSAELLKSEKRNSKQYRTIKIPMIIKDLGKFLATSI
jgi:hypothetical protein